MLSLPLLSFQVPKLQAGLVSGRQTVHMDVPSLSSGALLLSPVPPGRPVPPMGNLLSLA